ncbi:uncharacterized protein NEMAJ01_0474 [Nematocida major]|uniref:uncharacterized protein n=1 Tax=Nematocida major TaxID=1912982 RepID=UPI0020080556|nr:uncharacterized protein NEMAJ01_0474 [Nematocida major]KAH9385578.1 hypothetical protein NEMAJ01_0474 [Nematocida major]
MKQDVMCMRALVLLAMALAGACTDHGLALQEHTETLQESQEHTNAQQEFQEHVEVQQKSQEHINAQQEPQEHAEAQQESQEHAEALPSELELLKTLSMTSDRLSVSFMVTKQLFDKEKRLLSELMAMRKKNTETHSQPELTRNLKRYLIVGESMLEEHEIIAPNEKVKDGLNYFNTFIEELEKGYSPDIHKLECLAFYIVPNFIVSIAQKILIALDPIAIESLNGISNEINRESPLALRNSIIEAATTNLRTIYRILDAYPSDHSISSMPSNFVFSLSFKDFLTIRWAVHILECLVYIITPDGKDMPASTNAKTALVVVKKAIENMKTRCTFP